MMKPGQVITSLLFAGLLSAFIFCSHSADTASLQGGSPLGVESLLLSGASSESYYSILRNKLVAFNIISPQKIFIFFSIVDIDSRRSFDF